MITGPSTNNGTMISYSEGTMVQHDTGPGTAQSKTMSEIGDLLLLRSTGQWSIGHLYQGNCDTMVFNQGTMVVNESDDIGAENTQPP